MSRQNCICNATTGTICAMHVGMLGNIPRGPEPPTEEAIIDARHVAGIKLRRAIAASHIDSRLMDEALEDIAEFVSLRNG